MVRRLAPYNWIVILFFGFVVSASSAVVADTNSDNGSSRKTTTISHRVVVLTDADFERTTQALNPKATIKWFVKFYSPSCAFSKQLVPTWQELSLNVPDKVKIAAVDATSNPLLAKRFQITSYPTLILVSGGMQYVHHGDLSLEHLREYCTEGYTKEDTMALPIPPDNNWKVVQYNRFWNATKKNKYMRFLVSAMLVFNAVLIVGVVIRNIKACLTSKRRQQEYIQKTKTE